MVQGLIAAAELAEQHAVAAEEEARRKSARGDQGGASVSLTIAAALRAHARLVRARAQQEGGPRVRRDEEGPRRRRKTPAVIPFRRPTPIPRG